jgi:hypothetical protein
MLAMPILMTVATNVGQPLNFLHENGFVFVWDRVRHKACHGMELSSRFRYTFYTLSQRIHV